MGELTESQLLALWGKSDRSSPSNYHPLLFHLLDVGNCAQLLWRSALSDGLRKQLARALGFAPTELASAEQVAVLLAAQHDLGKASAFQLKEAVPELKRRAEDAGYSIESKSEKPHATVTAALLGSLAENGKAGWTSDEFDVRDLLSQITGGHHGTVASQSRLLDADNPCTCGKGIWEEARTGLLHEVCNALYPGSTIVTLPGPLIHPALIPLLAGFISVADWIGSSETYFPPTGSVTIREYSTVSRERAGAAMQAFGWNDRPEFAPPADFGEIFSDPKKGPFKPNCMQKAVVELVSSTTEPYLMIVEAAMGEGKTEAAVFAIDRALTAGLAHGFYIAMPTQATGNALFGRIHNGYFTKRAHSGRLNLHLVHGGSLLSDLYEELQMAANGAKPEDIEGALVAESWFVPKKQALLAPFGVGTIDQALLGSLQTSHWFVRLFGLAGKIVVFDEVHAYDVYMGVLLDNLLGWLKILGCRAVMLSATLPRERRRALFSAWGSTEVPEVLYPRVSFLTDGGAEAKHVPSKQPAKPLEVVYAPNDLTLLAERIRTDLPDGGCAAIICNTVARAVEAYDSLGPELAKDGWSVSLFHARTPAIWRKDAEQAALSQFGKPVTEGIDKRPTKSLLIATQVIEQSLDLDFDWMASDIAPIDLLLQRSGRLWRHERNARPVARARLVVLCGKRADGLPDFPKGCTDIYDEAVLLRTARTLIAGELRVPDCIESLVEEVYGAGAAAVTAPAWANALAEADQRSKRDSELETRKAEAVTIHKAAETMQPDEMGAILNQEMDGSGTTMRVRDSDDPAVHATVRAATRTGRPGVPVVLCGTDSDGRAMGHVQVKRNPDAAWLRRQLEWALSVSSRKLFGLLMNCETPWSKIAPIRFHRRLQFDHGVCTDLPGVRLTISRERGLVDESVDK